MGIEFTISLEKVSKQEAFELFFQDFPRRIARKGVKFEPEEGRDINENGVSFGKVLEFKPPDYAIFEWNTAASWNNGAPATFKVAFVDDPERDRLTVTISSENWGSSIFHEGNSQLEWYADQVASAFMSSIAPSKFNNWYTDTNARAPSGRTARETYRDPLYHWPNFRAILHMLSLQQNDYLLEVACGGGAFLRESLKSGCRAAAIDHSPEMVETATRQNAKAIEDGRLAIYLGDAHQLPFEDSTFSAAVCTGAFGFFENPDKFMSEVFRVLKNGGRFILFTGSKELKGTEADPEPISSMVHYYEDQELLDLAVKNGFNRARVESPDMEKYAEESGIPESDMHIFRLPGGGGQLLFAKK